MAIGKMNRVQKAKVLGAILSDVRFDLDDVSDVEHGLEHACSAQVAWRASLKGVRRDGSVVVLHVRVHIYVWVDPLNFRNGGLHRKRFRAIELRRDRMMRQQRNR